MHVRRKHCPRENVLKALLGPLRLYLFLVSSLPVFTSLTQGHQNPIDFLQAGFLQENRHTETLKH